ncbi:MAG: hypothetical protein IKG83_03870 [Prevotella sp.]|nr:hypothetical protein [Prevotella sp.]
MAKIDVSGIEGYADMSAEDKVKALEDFEFSENTDELTKYKNLVSQRNTEVGNLNKRIKELEAAQNGKMSEADKTISELQATVEELTKTNTFNSLKATYIGMGYSEELAAERAQAEVDGERAKAAEAERKFIEAHDKAIKAELLKDTPRPGKGGTGTPDTGMTLEKLRKMAPLDRKAWADAHQDEYKRLYGG